MQQASILAESARYQSIIQRKEAELFASPPQCRDSLFQDTDIHVFSRARPVFLSEASNGNFRIYSAHGRKCIIHDPGRTLSGSPRAEQKEYLLDHCFGCDATNEEVYRVIGSSFVPLALGGGTGTIMAYGQTGTGKTYTMNALTEAITRDYFGRACVEQSIETYVTYVEILGDVVKDLTTQEAVQLKEDRFGRVQLVGATEHRIEDADAFLHLTDVALRHRRTEATLKNATSSRSHAVVQLRVHNTDPAMRELNTQDGYLHLVDLAGSERAADRQSHTAARMMEAKLINTSLMTLKDCIKARSTTRNTNKHLHIPYRHSKLTSMLRDSFELAVRRPVKLAVIACVSPLATDASHSTNTLRYARALMAAPRTEVLERNDNDPTYWTKEECMQWCQRVSRGRIEPTDMLPNDGDNGATLVAIPEQEFIARATKAGRLTPIIAKKIYIQLWALVADARTAVRDKIYRVRKLSAKQDAVYSRLAGPCRKK